MGSTVRIRPRDRAHERAIEQAADAPDGRRDSLVVGGGPLSAAGTRQQMLDLLMRDLARLAPEHPPRRRV